jgi:hypothetical protein
MSMIALVCALYVGIPNPLDAVREGHARSREAIYSLYAKAVFLANYHGNPPRPPTRYSAEWWQDGESFRAKEVMLDGREGDKSALESRFERVWRNGRAKVLSQHSKGGKAAQAQGTIGRTDDLSTAISPWSWGLFELKDGVPFMEALRDSEKYVASVALEDVAGRSLIRVQFKAEGPMVRTAWFDAGVNYLVRKIRNENSDTGLKREQEITEFREALPGIFFPIRAAGRSANRAGQLTLESIAEVKVLRVNETIDSSVFELAFPKGTAVADEIKGIRYVAEDDEQPGTAVPASPLPPKASGRVQYATGQTPPESFSWRRAGAWTSIALVAACGVGWGVTRWRRRDQPTGV